MKDSITERTDNKEAIAKSDVHTNDEESSIEGNLESRRKEFRLANLENILERSSNNILNDYELRYGFYEEDNELYKYVNDLAKETLGDNYSKVKIYIAKNSPQCEAFALANGAIVITPKIIQVAKYKEALQALITHEAFHVIDEHSKKNLIKKINGNNSTRENVQMIGIKRAAEHMSDLYQHLLATNNDNINPMGSVALLENIDNYIKEKTPSVVHGFTSDRALVTEGVFYFYPFRNLSRDLNEIPENIINKIEPIEPLKRIDVSGRFDKDKKTEKYRTSKKRILDNAKDEDSPFFLREMVQVASANKKLADLIGTPLDVLTDTYFSDELWEEEEPWLIALDAAISLISCEIYDENNLKKNKNLEVIHKWKNDEYESKETFFEISKVVTDKRFKNIFSKHKLDVYTIIDFFNSTLSNYIALYEGNLTEKQLDLVDDLVCSLASAGEAFAKECSTFPMLSDDIKGNLYYNLARNVKNDSVKKYFNKFLSKRDKETRLDELINDERLKNIFRLIDQELKIMNNEVSYDEQQENEIYKDKFIENVDSFSKIFLNEIKKETNTEDIYLLIVNIYNVIYAANEQKNIYPLDSIILLALVDAINKSNLSETEKNNLLLNMFSNDGTIGSAHKDINQDDDIKSIISDFEGDHFLKLGQKATRILSKNVLGSIDNFLQNDLSREELKLTLKQMPGAGSAMYAVYDKFNGYHYQCKILAKYLSKYNSISDLISELETLEKEGLPAWKLIEDTHNSEQFSFVVYPLLRELIENDLDTDDFRKYREFARLITDNVVKKSFLSFINKKELESKTYEEKVDLIFKRINDKLAGFEDLKDLSEQEVCTKNDFDKLKESFKNNFNSLHDVDSENLGNLAVGTLVATGTQAASLKTARMTVGRDANEEIRKLLVEIDNLAKDFKTNGEEVFLTEADASRLNNRESKFFSASNSIRRAILIRILSGKNGLISNKGEYRKKFLSFLLNNILEEDNDSNLTKLLKDIVESSGEIESWKPLFFAIQNLLVDYTLKPNMNVPEWEEILATNDEWEVIDDKVENYNSLKDRKNRNYAQLENILNSSNRLNWRNKHMFSDGVNFKVLDFLEKQEYIEETTEFIELEVLDLILEVCQSAGSLGVRFLQLFPLFTNLKPEYKDKFSKAFDKVDGQSRFVAIMTLDDNWENFWDDVEYIYPGRVGGGSINTVLKLKMKENAYHPEFNGKTLTVKIRNPNLEFHLEETKKMLDEAIDGLIAIDPKYKIAKLIIDDVYLWIKNELNYENYVEKDKDFHNDLAEFNENNLGIEFITPETYTVPLKEGISDTNQVIVEDFIESDQITDGFSNLKEKGYEMKDVVSNMTRNYCFQLAKGFANSDVSIGNYLLAKGEEDQTLIAIIDKLYFLEFDDNIKDNLKPIITLLQILSEDPKKYAAKIRENLNLSISEKTIEEIEEHLNKLKDEFKDGSFTLSKVKEVFTDIVKLIPELDELISKVSNQDVILKDSEDFVRDAFSIFNQEISENDVSTLSKELNEARSALITNGSADGILSFAKKIVGQVDLNQETKELLEMLIGMYAFSVKSDADKINTLNKVVTNKEFASKLSTKQSVKSVFDSARERFKDDDFSSSLDIFHQLRDIGLKFDIRITLALKNIFALHQMAIDAGFKNGFFQALCYRKN